MKKNILFLVLISLLSSCKDVIDVDLNSVEPKIVIEATVRMENPAEVLITTTKDFGDPNTYTPITDALVVISDSEGNTETLRPDATGKYVATSIIGVERRTYYLSVTYENVEYTATSYMPPRVEIEELSIWKLPVKDYPDPRVHFTDPIGEENQYYRYILYIDDVRPTGKDRLKDRLLSTEFMDGSAIIQPIFISYEIDYDDDDDDPIKPGDTVTVEMQCIDKGVYTFFNTLYGIEGALANPTSNIKGGALGYFGAYSFTSKKIVMEWKE